MDTEPFPIKYIKQVRDNRLHQKYERAVGADRAYFAFDSDVKQHDQDIRQMCPEGLRNWVTNRENEIGHKPFMLVLLGQVGILRELNVPGIAVALTDDRDEKTKLADVESRRALVEGDVLMFNRTFNQIQQTMNDLNIKDFDLAIARGVQGGLWTTDSVEVNGKILVRILDLLNPKGGQFMVHGPNIHSDQLRPALERLSQCPNLKTEEFAMKGLPQIINDVKFTKSGQVDIKEFWRTSGSA